MKRVESLFLSVGVFVLLLLVVGCVHTAPRWTPALAAPPDSLDAALQKAAEAASNGTAALPSEATKELTRDGAVLTALARNRSLAVQRFAPDIAATRIDDAKAAFDPNLLATISAGKDTRPDATGDPSASRTIQGDAQVTKFFPTGTSVFLAGGLSRTRSSGDNTYSGDWSTGVNQSLLRGAGSEVNLVSIQQAENSMAQSQHALRGFVIDLVQQVENAYWDLVLAKETLRIREFSVQLAEEQLRLNENLIEVGKLAKDAIVSAQAELASRKADLVDAQAAVRSRTIDLIRLLDPESQSQWSLNLLPSDSPEVAQVEYNADTSAQLATLYRPDLAQARLDLANRDLDVIRTRNGLLPRLDAFASYGRISSGGSFSGGTANLDDPSFENYQAGLSFNMSPLNRTEKAQYRRATFQQQQAEAAVLNYEQLLEADVRRAAIEVRRQWERISATEEVVRGRREEVRVEQNRFRVGKSTNLDVLIIQKNLIQAELDQVTAKVRYIQAITALYRAEGTLLDRRGVGVEAKTE